MGRGRGQTNVHRPGKIGQSHEDLWNEYVLSELSYNGINCVDPSLDMGHTGKTWPWEKYFLHLEKICTSVKSEVNWLNVELKQGKLNDFTIYCHQAVIDTPIYKRKIHIPMKDRHTCV